MPRPASVQVVFLAVPSWEAVTGLLRAARSALGEVGGAQRTHLPAWSVKLRRVPVVRVWCKSLFLAYVPSCVWLYDG